MGATLYNVPALAVSRPPILPDIIEREPEAESSRLRRALSRLQKTRIKIRETHRGAPWKTKQKTE